MDPIAVSFLAGLGANLAGNMVTVLGRRLRDSLSTSARQRALQQCVEHGVTAMLPMCVADSEIELDHIRGMLEAFFSDADVAREMGAVLRGDLPQVDELRYLFGQNGGDEATLAGMDFAKGAEAFAAAFFASAANSDALRDVIDTHQLIKQTGIQEDMRESMAELVRLLREQRPESIGIKAGAIYAGSVVNGVQINVHGGDLGTGRESREHVAALRADYLHYVMGSVGQLSLLGIDPTTAAKPEAQINLGAVYTALLTLTPEESERLGKGGVPDVRSEELREMHSERRLSALTLLNQSPRLVLMGDPGSGKSTFVNFVALCLAGEALEREDANLAMLTEPLSVEEDEDSPRKRKKKDEPKRQPWEHGALIPVRVVLRDFAARGLPKGSRAHGKAKHLWEFIATELDAAQLGEYAEHLEHALRADGGLLLLDGLDEVPEAESRREQIKQAVEDFGDSFGRVRMLVTSRTYAYRQQDWRLSQFAEAVLAPFTSTQAERFIDRWYEHTADLRHLNRDDAHGRAELLKRAISSSERLAALAARPLLLTLMASLHAWRGGDLPEKREELYADTVTLLLEWWESPKVVRDADGKPIVFQPSLAEWLRTDRAKVRELLNEMAYRAHGAQPETVGTADIPEGELLSGLLHLSRNPVASADSGKLVDYLSSRAGLLLPRGVGVYTFPHRMFQEYLAACYLTDRETPETIADLARSAPDRWREVVLLAGAKLARGGDFALWALVERLCVHDIAPGDPQSLEDAWGALLAGNALVESTDLTRVNEVNEPKLERIGIHLVRILEAGELPAVERAEAGRVLAKVGDPRFREDALRLPDDESWGFLDVPAGPFTMGTRKEDVPALAEKYGGITSWYGRQTEQHEVTVPQFYIARYPVTNAQFSRFVEAGGYADERYWAEAKAAEVWREGAVKASWESEPRVGPADREEPFGFPNHPVVEITWYEMLAYCRWLTDKLRSSEDTPEPLADLLRNDGWSVCLPSEAEWEKAARGAGGPREFPWGDEIAPDLANYDDTGIGSTTAVGCFPKGVGRQTACLDLAGNVWEWTRSVYAEYPYQPGPERENLAAGKNCPRVLRGGSWKPPGPRAVRVPRQEQPEGPGRQHRFSCMPVPIPEL